ncbi:MAG: NAD(P)-dependent oxidoreductase [Burkholderiales bacterium]
MKIGIAGMGKMGTVLAVRLAGLGHEVTVWNRTAAKTQAAQQAGAKVAAKPRELAGSADIIISILTNAEAIDAAYEGKDGLLAGDIKGKLFIEMSTVRPVTEKALAAKLAGKEAAMIDCPVGGSVGPAREGKLFGFAGGAAADVARAKPLLDQLCRRVEHVGPVGAGASMKLAINQPLLVYWQALGEALVLCKPLGLDPARVMDILADTSGGPNVLKVRGPAIAKALIGEDTGVITFDIDSIRKDLQTMIQEAQALGGTLPVTARALECFDEASRDGLGKGDATLLPARWSKKSAH